MTDLDGQIRQLLHEVVDAAPPLPEPAPVLPSSPPPTSTRRYHLALIAVAVAIGLAGLSVRVRQHGPVEAGDPGGSLASNSTTIDDASAVPSLSAPSSTTDVPADPHRPSRAVEELTVDSWPLPMHLPDGLSLSSAIDLEAVRRSVIFEGPDARSMEVAVSDSLPEQFPGPGVDEQIAGATWTWTGPLRAERLVGRVGLTVSAVGLSRQEVKDVIDSLAVVDEEQLGRPVLRPMENEGYVEVGSVMVDGSAVTLEAKSDGRRYATRSGHHLHSGTQLPEGDSIVFDYWLDPASVADTTATAGVIVAVTGPGVTRVEAVLRDGTILSTTPQDRFNSFPDDFALLVVPGAAPTSINDVERLVAYDSTGMEIGRVARAGLPQVPLEP